MRDVEYDTPALKSALAKLRARAAGEAAPAGMGAGLMSAEAAALLAKIEAADRLAEAAYRALPLMPALYANGTPCTEFGKLGETLADYRNPQPAKEGE
jgi:hypothetical protein